MKIATFTLAFASVFSLLLIAGCVGGEESPAAPAYNPNPALDAPLFDTNTSAPSYQYAPTSQLEIAFIDVGYGDATLIRSQGKSILFDAGPDANADALGNYLRKAGVQKIDILILSSDDPLFINGAPEILRTFEVGEIWSNGHIYSGANWEKISGLAEDIPISDVEYANSFEDGNFTLTVLNPFPGLKNTDYSDMDSIVLKAQYENFCAVLFSNSEASGAVGSDGGTVFGGVDNRILNGPISIEGCKVLKVSHHGSGNSASFQLLERMKPEVAIISVGKSPANTKYPDTTLLRRLLLKNMNIYTTDKLGTITIKSDGQGYEAQTELARDTSYIAFINNIAYGKQSYFN
ncbi:hypothetical protein COU37_00165 [Candidatus Micrarchaeota archaeon CG10_big_fil_rev_8_21_14_0_10_45_29]|nr:MAG: hypothetical protein COU37_00165 [Candidatus Micrarchaeota archaeon CG10_big_fil_rev_8_21_14_0_10_45_29]